ncbi:MAG TPA: autotransporter domain-containing protein [bacterium]|nr:autotransporter domain-containing protein [bacterium]
MKHPTFLASLVLALGLSPWTFAQTYTVTANSGGTGAGSLGAALNSAAGDGASTSDTINFGPLFNSFTSILQTGSYTSVTKNAGTTLTVSGTGVLTLFLDGSGNHYTSFDFGGGGTLSLNNMSMQNGVVSIGSGSVLELNTVRDFPGSVTITGGGGLLVAGGFNYLGGHNDFTGGITVTNGATLQADPASLGDTATTITLDGGTLEGGLQGLFVSQTIQITAAGGTLNGSGDIDGDILGSHGVSYVSAGVTLSGNKSYTGNTWATNSSFGFYQSGVFGSGPATLFFDNVGWFTTGSVTMTQDIDITNNFTLDEHYHDDVLNGTLSGSGNLILDDGVTVGSLTLTQANSYSGSTTVNGGTLALSGNGTLGAGLLAIGANGNFDISAASAPVTVPSVTGAGTIHLGANQLVSGSDNSSTTLSGAIGGTGGSFIKVGTGTLTLGGANSFTGGLLLDSGAILAASNSALGAGSVTVAGGTLAMAGGPRTLNIGGDYVQGSAVTLKMGLASAFPYDQLNIAGNASLAGALTIFNYSVIAPTSGQSFLLLQTGGTVSGRFDNVTDPFTTVRMLPIYEPTQVFLVAVLPSFTALAVTPNQKAVAAALDQAFGSAGTQDLTISLGQQTTSSLPSNYDQIAPTGILPVFPMGFAAARAQADMVSRRFSKRAGDDGLSRTAQWGGREVLFAGDLPASEEASMAKGASGAWGLFVERQSVSESLAGDANAPGYQFTSSGLTAGLENHLSKDLILGLLLGYGQSDSVPGANGAVNATGGQAGLYAGWRATDAYLEASFAAGLDRYQVQRPSYGGYAAGSTGGTRVSGQLGAGFDTDLGPTRAGLFASGQYVHVGVDGFTETGSLSPLTFPAQGENSVVSDLGTRASRRLAVGDLIFDPSLSLAWEHRYEGSSDALSAGFSGSGAFTVTGPTAWSDGLAAEAGLGVRVSRTFKVSMAFRDLVAFGNGGSQGFSGGLDMGF